MTTLQEVFRAAASRFLQSVVVVDDRAALRPDEDALPPDDVELVNPGVRPDQEPHDPPTPAALEAEHLAEAAAAHEGGAPVNALDAGSLIDRFADRGIVCAALKPDLDDTGVENRVLSAGRRADIVTLDWHLGEGESGERARHLLDRLTEPMGSRLRLVALYTGEPDAELLRSEITRLDGVAAIDNYRFRRGSARIVLLFKAGTEEIGAPTSQVVPVDDLPDRLIDEFALMSAGLVPAGALSSLGAIREATPEIVGVLNADLDPGFVGHRLAQVLPDDSWDHLTDLVVSEIRSVLELDSEPPAAANATSVQLWLDECPDPEVSIEREALSELNIKGSGDSDILDEIREKYPKLRGTPKKTYPTRYFVADAEKAYEHDARLAERMSTRHAYQNSRPDRLELGVVLRCLADDSCWVCVQPVCDSVRLTSATSMPMLPVVPTTAATPWDLTVAIDTVPTYFEIVIKPSRLRTVAFEPDLLSRSILAAPLTNGSPGFTDANGAEWSLICRLKTAHGQRLAHRLGNAFSRVALNESEWQVRRTPR